MTLEELSLELKELVGETVSYKRIAGNSIIIYFFGEPGDEGVVSVLICPTWRYQQHGKIIIGSNDFPLDESDFKSQEEYWHKCWDMYSLTDGLEGARLENCDVDLETSNILMEFSDGQVLRNFEQCLHDAAWIYESRPRNFTAYVSPSGIRLKTDET